MLTLTTGANAPIEDGVVEITVKWPTGRGSLDCSAYLLGDDGRVRDDADMVFYNQPGDRAGATRMESTAGVSRLRVELARVPADVTRIAMCATIEGTALTMRDFAGLAATLEAGGERRMQFAPELDAHRSLRVVELYRLRGRWKLRAVGQGFAAGLGKLAGEYGVAVDEGMAGQPVPDPPPALSSPPYPVPPPPPSLDEPVEFPLIGRAPPPPPPPFGDVLGPDRPTITWPADPAEPVTMSLGWASRCGGLDGRPRAIDLALGCFFELADGSRGVLQETGRRSAGGEPALLALAPASMSEAKGKQALTIDGARISMLRSLTLYAVIASGAPNWRAADVRLQIAVKDRPPVIVPVQANDEDADGCAVVAIARLASSETGLQIARVDRFAFREPELDVALAWGLDWR